MFVATAALAFAIEADDSSDGSSDGSSDDSGLVDVGSLMAAMILKYTSRAISSCLEQSHQRKELMIIKANSR